MSTFKNFDRMSAALAFLLLWYAIFEWNFIDYPSYRKGPCYSPNHAFYVTRHQTMWQALTKNFRNEFGTIRVFDRSGIFLHEQEFFVDEESGPMWSDQSNKEPAGESLVLYMGGDGSSWKYLLPGPPGQGSANRNCY
jgi:hypothetical protein